MREIIRVKDDSKNFGSINWKLYCPLIGIGITILGGDGRKGRNIKNLVWNMLIFLLVKVKWRYQVGSWLEEF